MSVVSCIALHIRYIPILALTVVISKVPSILMTSSRDPMISSFVMMTSWCSLPIYSATSFAYFRSIASSLIPMAKVLIGFPGISFCATAQTSELSRPPLNRNPIGASESRRFAMPLISFCFIVLHITSTGSSHTVSTFVRSI